MKRTADRTSISEKALAAVLAAVPFCPNGNSFGAMLTRKQVHQSTRYPLARDTIGQALTVLVQRGLVAYEERPIGSGPGRLYFRVDNYRGEVVIRPENDLDFAP